MPPSFHPRVETKDEFFDSNIDRKAVVLNESPGNAALTVNTLTTAPFWTTKGSLRWFQCIRNHWQNSPRTPVQAVLPFSDFCDDEFVDSESLTLRDDNSKATTPDVEETKVNNVQEASLECDESENDRSEQYFLVQLNPDSLANENHDTSTDFTINDSADLIDISYDAAVNITTSTGSSLQEQIESLHHSIDESKERLLHTQTKLEEHIELLKSRQLRNRDGPMMLRGYAFSQTLQGISNSHINGSEVLLSKPEAVIWK